jgi:hypothetical protein
MAPTNSTGPTDPQIGEFIPDDCASVNNSNLVLAGPTRSSVHGLNLRECCQSKTARKDSVSRFAETRFTSCFNKPAELQVWTFAPSPSGQRVVTSVE